MRYFAVRENTRNYLTNYQWITWAGFTNYSPVHILWTNSLDITGTIGNPIIVGQQVALQGTATTRMHLATPLTNAPSSSPMCEPATT